VETTDEYAGPLTPTGAQLEAVVALANRVFRAAGGDMGEDYPLLFHRDRLDQLRIFTEAGRCVSLVGMTINDVVLLGCPLRIACIGSVCTDESARGRGLASRLMDDAYERAAAAGAPVMLISGGRGLYTRRGASGGGRFAKYVVPVGSIQAAGADLTIGEVGPETAALALRLFDAEPIRFSRTEEEYTALVACRRVGNNPGSTYLVRRAGEPPAVLSVHPVRTDNSAGSKTIAVQELAGSRPAALAGLRRIAGNFGAQAVQIYAYMGDRAMRRACAAAGAELEVVAHTGTVKLLDAGRLWKGFGPLLAERIGTEAAAKLRLRAQADELKIHTLSFELSDERFVVHGAEKVVAALFGSPQLDPLAGAPGELGQTLRAALPLPLPMYGLNYI